MENSISANLQEQIDSIFKQLKISTQQEVAQLLKDMPVKDFSAWYYGTVCQQVGELDTKFRRKVFAYIEQHRQIPIAPTENRKEILDSNPIYGAVLDAGLQIIYQKLDELAQYPEFIEKMKAYRDFQIQEQHEKDLHITVDGVNYRATEIIPVLWQGWESDDKAWLVKVGQNTRLVTSSHGQLSWSPVSFLEEKLKEYEAAAQATKAAIEKLKSSSS